MAIEMQTIHMDHPHPRLIRHAANILEHGGVIIYPTDTIYGLGADLFNKKAIERIIKIKHASQHKLLSFICHSLSDIAQWAFIPDYAYRIMRRTTPGKYTFILRASKEVPKILLQKRDTVGIRIPDAPVALALCTQLGRPILSASVPSGADGFFSDPQEMAQMFKHSVDLLLDAGTLANLPSTIVDFSKGEVEILREGAGDPRLLFAAR